MILDFRDWLPLAKYPQAPRLFTGGHDLDGATGIVYAIKSSFLPPIVHVGQTATTMAERYWSHMATMRARERAANSLNRN